MSDYSKLENKANNIAKQRCNIDSYRDCVNPNGCSCYGFVRMQYILYNEFPKGFANKKLDDLSGRNEKGKELLSPKTLKRTKEQIIKYCWKDIDLDSYLAKMYEEKELYEKSIIEKRRKLGHHVVIYSELEDLYNKDFKNQRGSTLVAFLIFREAVNSLVSKSSRFSCKYIRYADLLGILEERADERHIYEEADWLVVDNVDDKQSYYKRNCADSFFAKRCRLGLPTILVIKKNIENIESRFELDKMFGSGISEIISDSNTFKIGLY